MSHSTPMYGQLFFALLFLFPLFVCNLTFHYARNPLSRVPLRSRPRCIFFFPPSCSVPFRSSFLSSPLSRYFCTQARRKNEVELRPLSFPGFSFFPPRFFLRMRHNTQCTHGWRRKATSKSKLNN